MKVKKSKLDIFNELDNLNFNGFHPKVYAKVGNVSPMGLPGDMDDIKFENSILLVFKFSDKKTINQKIKMK